MFSVSLFLSLFHSLAPSRLVPLSLAHSLSFLSLSVSFTLSSLLHCLSFYICLSRYGVSSLVTPILALLYSSSPMSDRLPYCCISPRCELDSTKLRSEKNGYRGYCALLDRRSSSPSPPFLSLSSSLRSTPVFNRHCLSFFLSLSLSLFLTIAGREHRTGRRRAVLAAASSVCRDDAMDVVVMSNAKKKGRASASHTAVVMSNDTRRSTTTSLPRRRAAAR